MEPIEPTTEPQGLIIKQCCSRERERRDKAQQEVTALQLSLGCAQEKNDGYKNLNDKILLMCRQATHNQEKSHQATIDSARRDREAADARNDRLHRNNLILDGVTQEQGQEIGDLWVEKSSKNGTQVPIIFAVTASNFTRSRTWHGS